MRHLPETPPPRKGTEYRVRMPVSQLGQDLLGLPEWVTTKPGIIKNNRPKAERVLKAIQESNKPDAFIEVRSINPDTEWKKLND